MRPAASVTGMNLVVTYDGDAIASPTRYVAADRTVQFLFTTSTGTNNA